MIVALLQLLAARRQEGGEVQHHVREAEKEVLGTVDFRNFIVFFWAETLAH